jgi:hypothetical protein
VLRRVPPRRAVAAADVAALQADPQMAPRAAGGEALLATLDRVGQLGQVHVVEVGADVRDRFSLPAR